MISAADYGYLMSGELQEYFSHKLLTKYAF